MNWLRKSAVIRILSLSAFLGLFTYASLTLFFIICPAVRSELIVAIGVFLAVIAASAIFDASQSQLDPFEVKTFLLVVLTVFVLPLPIRAFFTTEVTGSVSEYLPQFLPYLAPSVWLVTAGVLCFYISYHAQWPSKLVEKIPRFSGRADNPYIHRLILLQVFAAILFLALMKKAGGIGAYLSMGYAATTLTTGVGYLAIGIPWLLVSVLFAYHLSTERGTPAAKIYFRVCFLGFLALSLLLGKRNTLLYLMLVMAIYRHYAIKPIRLKTFAWAGLAAFVGLNLIGVLRVAGTAGGGFRDLFSKLGKGWEVVQRSDSGKTMFYTLTVGEFVVPFETLPMLMNSIPQRVEFAYGKTYLLAPVYLVPSPLYPDRPEPLAVWYYDTFYPGVHLAGQGRQFFFISEAYYNFGVPGVLILMLLLGASGKIFYLYMKRNGATKGSIIVYAIVVGWIVRSVPGDAASFVSGLTQQSLVATFWVLYSPKKRIAAGQGED